MNAKGGREVSRVKRYGHDKAKKKIRKFINEERNK